MTWKLDKHARYAKSRRVLDTLLQQSHSFFALATPIQTSALSRAILPVNSSNFSTRESYVWLTDLLPSLEILTVHERPPLILSCVFGSAELLHITSALYSFDR